MSGSRSIDYTCDKIAVVITAFSIYEMYIGIMHRNLHDLQWYSGQKSLWRIKMEYNGLKHAAYSSTVEYIAIFLLAAGLQLLITCFKDAFQPFLTQSVCSIEDTYICQLEQRFPFVVISRWNVSLSDCFTFPLHSPCDRREIRLPWKTVAVVFVRLDRRARYLATRTTSFLSAIVRNLLREQCIKSIYNVVSRARLDISFSRDKRQTCALRFKVIEYVDSSPTGITRAGTFPRFRRNDKSEIVNVKSLSSFASRIFRKTPSAIREKNVRRAAIASTYRRYLSHKIAIKYVSCIILLAYPCDCSAVKNVKLYDWRTVYIYFIMIP